MAFVHDGDDGGRRGGTSQTNSRSHGFLKRRRARKRADVVVLRYSNARTYGGRNCLSSERRQKVEESREDPRKKLPRRRAGQASIGEVEDEREGRSRDSCRRALKNVLSPEKAAPVPASAARLPSPLLFHSLPFPLAVHLPPLLTGLLSAPHYLAILASCLPVKPADTAKRYRIGECGKATKATVAINICARASVFVSTFNAIFRRVHTYVK